MTGVGQIPLWLVKNLTRVKFRWVSDLVSLRPHTTLDLVLVTRVVHTPTL